MTKYAILANPGYNKTYFASSKPLSLAELSVTAGSLQSACHDIGQMTIAGITYYCFSCDQALSQADLGLLSHLSFLYALFEVIPGEQQLLKPLLIPDQPFFDRDISSILKYSGKTNELFTRLMINLALLSSDFSDNQPIRLLDPLAGKGTTLFEGLMRGFDVSGIEIGSKAVHETAVFLKKYLETGRYKHTMKKEKLSGPNKSFSASVYRFEMARDKNALKDQASVRDLTLVAGDARLADQFFRKNSFHLLVADLPYGVQHGNVTNEKQNALTRNPDQLLKVCLPSWHAVLKPGGVIALAWNRNVLSREKLAAICEKEGFTVINDYPYDQFEHRVDQAIRRDILIAKKPTGKLALSDLLML